MAKEWSIHKYIDKVKTKSGKTRYIYNNPFYAQLEDAENDYYNQLIGQQTPQLHFEGVRPGHTISVQRKKRVKNTDPSHKKGKLRAAVKPSAIIDKHWNDKLP